MATTTPHRPGHSGPTDTVGWSSDARALTSGLGRIQQRRQILLGVLVMLVPAILVHQGMGGPRLLRDAIVLGWVAAYAVTAMVMVWSRCPRCHQLFHRVLGFHNPFSRRCQSCGLGLDGSEPR